MPFGSRFVGIEIGANSVRAVAIRKVRSTYRVVAAEKIEPDPAAGKLLDFPEGGGTAAFSPEAAEILRRFGRGARKCSVVVSDVEILLRHLPIPRSAGENLQPLIRAVLAAPTEEEVTFTYKRLPKAAPAPDHDLVLVAASRGLKLRRLVAGLKDVAVRVAGLTPHSESLLHLARTAAAEIPPGTPVVSLDSERAGEPPESTSGAPGEGGAPEGPGDTFILIDEGGPLFAIAPDSDMRAVTFALIEEGDLLFARRAQITTMTGEGGKPADGLGVINEISEEANRTLDLAKGTLKRSDLVPGDVRIFGRRRLCSELASNMTRRMGVPVRIVPAEGWGAVTAQSGVVFDPGDFAIALGLAIGAAEEDLLVVPPATARVERLGVHGRMRIVAAVTAAAFIFLPSLRWSLYSQAEELNQRRAETQLQNYIREESIIKGRAVSYQQLAGQYLSLLLDSEDDGGVFTISRIFDLVPAEMKFSSLRVAPTEARDKWILPPGKKRVTISGLIDASQVPNSLRLLGDFAQALERERVAAPGSAKPQPQGEVEYLGRRFERFEVEFLTPERAGKGGS